MYVKRAPSVMLLALLGACVSSEDDPTDFRHRVTFPPLEEVAVYGSSEPADSAAATTAGEPDAVGVIGRAIAVEEGPDSVVYVRDMFVPRAVAFEHDGSVRRQIGSGPGEGPGEFRRPVGLTIDQRRPPASERQRG